VDGVAHGVVHGTGGRGVTARRDGARRSGAAGQRRLVRSVEKKEREGGWAGVGRLLGHTGRSGEGQPGCAGRGKRLGWLGPGMGFGPNG
jgi:hypothetical protein